MSKNIFKYIFVFLAFGMIFSCSSNTEELILELEQIGLDKSDTNPIYTSDGTGSVVSSGIRVVLIGPQSASPINFNINVAALRDSSTAIENLHYRLTEPNGAGTIPPNASFAEVPIEIIPDEINLGEPLDLYLEINSSDQDVAKNFNGVRYNLGITCPLDESLFLGDYTLTYTDAFFPFSGAGSFGADGKTITLEPNAGSSSKRQFTFTHLEELAIGQPAVDFVFGLICGQVVPDVLDGTNLSCDGGATPITMGAPAENPGEFNPQDDSSFTLVWMEFVMDGGCDVNPPLRQEALFTKQ